MYTAPGGARIQRYIKSAVQWNSAICRGPGSQGETVYRLVGLGVELQCDCPSPESSFPLDRSHLRTSAQKYSSWLKHLCFWFLVLFRGKEKNKVVSWSVIVSGSYLLMKRNNMSTSAGFSCRTNVSQGTGYKKGKATVSRHLSSSTITF